MKIVKQADPNEWSHKFTCVKCKSELEAECNDVKYRYYKSEMFYPPTEYYFISCPVCEEQNALSLNDGNKIPEIVLIRAKERTKDTWTS